MIPDAQQGQRPSASHINAIRDAACRAFSGGFAHSSLSGVVAGFGADRDLDLYELTGAPELDADLREYKATAKPVRPRLCSVDGEGHYTGDVGPGEGGVERYRATAKEETIWFLSGARDETSEPAQCPAAVEGSRVWVALDNGRRVALTDQQTNQLFYNASGETVPAYAVMAVTGVQTLDDGRVVPKIAKPSATFSRNYIINGAADVPVADPEAEPPTIGVGVYQDSDFRDVQVLYGDASVAAGDELGPKPGSWALWKGYPGIATGVGVVDAGNQIALVRIKSLDFVWCELQADLEECGQATALVIVPDASGELCATQWSLTVLDSHNAVSSSALAQENPESGAAYVPSGMRVLVQLHSNSAGRAVAFGEGDCCAEESSSPPSESSQSSQSSVSSQSSASSQSSVSPSSGSQPSPSEPSQSSKSEAIVPASWTPGGYTGLFIAEMPDVRFDDVMECAVEQRNQAVPIDPRFMEVCEPGTIRVCGTACDWPVAVGARIEGESVALRFGARKLGRTVRVVLRLSGVRKGFGDTERFRFPNRTKAQFEANERFLKRMYQQASAKRR